MERSFESVVTAIRKKMGNALKDIQIIHDKGRQALSDPITKTQFLGMYRAMEKYVTKFEGLWDQLVDYYEDHEKGNDFPSSQDNQLKLAVQKCYHESNVVFEKLSRTPVDPSLNSDGTSLGNTRSSQNLPRITLHQFDGELMNWPKYRDLFLSLVHNEDSLSAIQKFHYLLSSLSGTALSTIQHLQLLESNYELAWSTLMDTYNNKRMLATVYLNNILNFKFNHDINKQEGFKAFLTQVSDSVSAFKLLEITNESDFILFYLAMRCVDSRTREQFELAHKEDTFPSFNTLDKFIREKNIALKLADVSLNSNENRANQKPFHADQRNKYPNKQFKGKTSLMTNPSKSRNTTTTSQPNNCIICKENWHSILSCKKFHSATVEQRINWLHNWKGCRNCLSSNHTVLDCTSKWHCRFCQLRHHSLLHKHNSSYSNTQSSESKNTSEPNNLGGATSLNTTSRSESLVLLGTAWAHIQDCRGVFRPVRMVIDSGSQFSFITHKFVKKLGLKHERCHHAISGIGQSIFDGAKGSISCKLKPIKSHEPILETQAVVVTNITSHLPQIQLPQSLKSN